VPANERPTTPQGNQRDPQPAPRARHDTLDQPNPNELQKTHITRLAARSGLEDINRADGDPTKPFHSFWEHVDELDARQRPK
jgi:hypothetical protein